MPPASIRAMPSVIACAIVLLAAIPAWGAMSWEVVRDPADGAPVLTTAWYVPDAVRPGSRLPAILLFHGGEHHASAGDGDDREYVEEMLKVLRRNRAEDGWILIAPHSPGRGWRWDVQRPEVLADLRRLSAWMFAALPVDARRVYYIGRSNGGASAGPVAIDQPGLYAGLMPWTGGPESDFAAVDPARFPDYYLVASAGEEPGWHAQIIDRLLAIRGRGIRAIYHQPEGLTHLSVHQRADLYDDGLRWFSGLRSKVVPPPPADRELLGRLLLRSPIALSAAELSEVERIGGAEGQAVLVAGLAAADPDLRRRCADSLGRCVAVPSATAALIAAMADADPGVRSAVAAALGWQAHWRDLAAQSALCRLAGDRTRASADRRAALDALYGALMPDQAGAGGIAIDLDARPVNVEEGRILWTWGDVLADADPGLRRAAAAGLLAFGADLAGYDPDGGPPPDDRLAATAAWLARRCGDRP